LKILTLMMVTGYVPAFDVAAYSNELTVRVNVCEPKSANVMADC
jgi:hypothetical protein